MQHNATEPSAGRHSRYRPTPTEDPRGAVRDRAVTPSPRPSAVPMQRACACGGGSRVGGECHCDEKKDRPTGGVGHPPALNLARACDALPIGGPKAIQGVWKTLNASGVPLDPVIRNEMELMFGTDFSGVRIHTGPQAAQSARSVNALAYTVAPHIVFGDSHFAPHTEGGKRVLAHELAHVVQQSQGAVRGSPTADGALSISDPSDPFEREADLIASQVTMTSPKTVAPALLSQNTAPTAQRACSGDMTGVLQRAPAPIIERKRAGQGNQINKLLGGIKDLRWLRIDAWEKAAHSKEPQPGMEVLAAIISIVSLGLGGVVYAAMEGMISKGVSEYLKEFILLSGLEAGDQAAEAIFYRVLRENKDDFDKGVRNAIKSSEKNSKLALAGGGDAIDTYVEALKLQAVDEDVQEGDVFNSSAASLSDDDLAARSAALELTYRELSDNPSAFMRELTTGFIRLLDEMEVAEKADDYGGERAKARQMDDELHQTIMRSGNLLVFPWPRIRSIGKWYSPTIDFPGFAASSVSLNTKILKTIRGAKIKDLRVSMAFQIRVDDPYYRIFKGDLGLSDVGFVVDPDGAVHVGSDVDDDAQEWLGSYYTQSAREFSSDSERWMMAMLGAQKLYNVIKNMPITNVNEDI
jgi:hypothetical protein